ncbi:MAG: hypothetical protein OYL41_04420 [Acidobacteriota bacterium]|nr:hypothetical protein [Acidobacteriota bacterium]
MTGTVEGRGEPLLRFGWPERHADWIALVCPTGGFFTRAQLAAFLGVGLPQAARVVRRMLERKIAVERVLEGRKVCRIRSKTVYRALGLDPQRGRWRIGTEAVVVRLLSLDYVVDHPGLPWLPTATEQVRAFEAAGIKRELLPSRLSGGRAPQRVLYFPRAFPVAFGGGRALFAFTDPGYARIRPLRKWAGGHRRLWEALRARGHRVEVVAIVRAVRELRRSRRALDLCRVPDPSPSSGEGRAARSERKRIERAILEGSDEALPVPGDIQSGLRRIAALREIERSVRAWPEIDAAAVWRSSRLPGGWC